MPMMEDNLKSRREFLYLLPGLALSAVCLTSCSDESDDGGPTEPPVEEPRPARAGVANPYVNSEDQPILVCVEGDDFDTMLEAGLNRLGGLSQLVDANQSVLIKPNCNYTDIYPGISSANSVAALVTAACQVTTGTVLVGDEGYHRSSVVYPHMGLEEAVTNAGGSLISLVRAESYPVRQEHWDSEIPDARAYHEIYDAPIIISTSCLKRHRYAVMTCALKNNVGAVTGHSMGGSRAYLHSLDGADFQRWVAEIAALIKPELTVVDARSILCVDGPLTDWGDIARAHRVILSGDMVATDAYAAQLLASHDNTFSADMIQPTLERAEQLGLGTSDLSQVEVVEISA